MGMSETLSAVFGAEPILFAAAHELRTDWAKFAKDYFLNRQNLVSVLLLRTISLPKRLTLSMLVGWGRIRSHSSHVAILILKSFSDRSHVDVAILELAKDV